MIDYSAIGFKAGLEIHQQVDSSTKLFCRCPTIIRDDAPDVVVKRLLRASAGEAGVVDVAAAYEQQRGKHFLYHGYNDTTCAVELDEEPIHDLNNEALTVALQTALLLHAKIADKLLVMRKTVVDGSNTSGFQRTALVARNGAVDMLSGTVGIATVCIEEESAKIVSRSEEQDVYNLSRLGIALIEIATEADIKDPQQLRDVAEYLGMTLRSTGKVKRGLGTIRQDVNVSIKGGARVEIKGAQDLRLLSKLAEYEVLRQKNLLDIAEELRKRSATVDKTVVDITDVLKESESKLVKSTLQSGGAIKALRLAKFAGLLGREVQPGRRLGTEFSDYAKSYGGVSGIIHSDELPKYGITDEEIAMVRKKLGCAKDDAFAFVAAGSEKADRALFGVIERAEQSLKGVAKEVRKANADGTTTFLRPMPGSARMYPETDSVAISPPENVTVPQLLSEKTSSFEKYGLSKDLAHTIVKEGADGFFEEMVETHPSLSPAYIAEVIVSYPKEMQKKKLDYDLIGDDHLKMALSAVASGTLAKESLMDALSDVAAGGRLELEKYKTLSDAELEAILKQIVAQNKGLATSALIGKAMGQLRGKAPGQKIVEMLKRLS